MTDEAEKQAALNNLNQKYNADRKAAAMEYARLMAEIVMPVWEQGDIQEAKTQVGELMQILRQYSAAANDAEKKEFLPRLNQLTASMDEGALTEYVGLLTQIQSLLDSGMTESEVQSMFPDIDFSGALDQLTAIQTYSIPLTWTLPWSYLPWSYFMLQIRLWDDIIFKKIAGTHASFPPERKMVYCY